MAQKRILLIEDEKDIAELVRHVLTREGHAVSRAATGEEGLRLARAEPPNLILLDLMLPGVDGLDVCRALKRDRATDGIPIVMLTARSEESDIVVGLELGADDYVTKPFSPKVLAARVRAVLRRRERRPAPDDGPLRIHDLTLHPGRHEVRVGSHPVELTATEFRLLRLLAGRPGWVFTRNQIVDAVRGEDYPVTDRSVDVHIVGLRRKLGPAGEYIETVRGVGYRFREE
jgi:two-component system phosphate regulon response regulator PhoB